MFANPLMASATMDRLVHRAVKIVIEGKSYRMDSFRAPLTGTAAAVGGPAMRPDRAVARGCSGTHLARRRGLTGRPGAIFFRRWAESASEARRSVQRGLPRHSSATLSARPGLPPSATPTDDPAATGGLPAAVGSGSVSGSNLTAPSTRTRRSGLIQHSPRFTT